jgi:hypothetical protein
VGRRRDRVNARPRREATVVSANVHSDTKEELETAKAVVDRQSNRILRLEAQLQAARRYPQTAYGDLTAALSLVGYIESRVGERTSIVDLLRDTLSEVRDAAATALRPPTSGTGLLDEAGVEITIVERAKADDRCEHNQSARSCGWCYP